MSLILNAKNLKQKDYYNMKLFLSEKLTETNTSQRKRKIVIIHTSDKGPGFSLYETLL